MPVSRQRRRRHFLRYRPSRRSPRAGSVPSSGCCGGHDTWRGGAAPLAPARRAAWPRRPKRLAAEAAVGTRRAWGGQGRGAGPQWGARAGRSGAAMAAAVGEARVARRAPRRCRERREGPGRLSGCGRARGGGRVTCRGRREAGAVVPCSLAGFGCLFSLCGCSVY